MTKQRMAALVVVSLLTIALFIIVALAVTPTDEQDPNLAGSALAIAAAIVTGLLVLLRDLVQHDDGPDRQD